MKRMVRWGSVVPLLAILAACALPGPAPNVAVAPDESRATLAPAQSEPATAAAQAKPTQALPTPTAIPESLAPLGEGVLLARWNSAARLQELRPVDPATGGNIAGYAPIPLGWHFIHAVSPDGRILALVAYPGQTAAGGVLHLIDLQAWEDKVTGITLDEYTQVLAFSPDGTQLLMVTGFASSAPKGSTLRLVSLPDATVRAQASVDVAIGKLVYSPDGRSLYAYGQAYPTRQWENPESHALVLAADDLRVEWDQALAAVTNVQHQQTGQDPTRYYWYQPAVALSPKEEAAFIVHADEDKLTTVDYARRTVRTAAIVPAQSWLDRLLALTAGVAHAKMTDGTVLDGALSPDGERFYVVGQTTATSQGASGNWEFQQTHEGLRVIDVNDGGEVATLDTEASQVRVSADGAHLFLLGWKDSGQYGTPWWTEIVDAATLEIVVTLDGYAVMPGRRLNGAPILLSSHNTTTGLPAVAALDPETFELLFSWSERADTLWWLTGP